MSAPEKKNGLPTSPTYRQGYDDALRQVRDAMLEITNGHTIMVGGREWLMHAMFDKGGRFEITEEEE